MLLLIQRPQRLKVKKFIYIYIYIYIRKVPADVLNKQQKLKTLLILVKNNKFFSRLYCNENSGYLFASIVIIYEFKVRSSERKPCDFCLGEF